MFSVPWPASSSNFATRISHSVLTQYWCSTSTSSMIIRRERGVAAMICSDLFARDSAYAFHERHTRAKISRWRSDILYIPCELGLPSSQIHSHKLGREQSMSK